MNRKIGKAISLFLTAISAAACMAGCGGGTGSDKNTIVLNYFLSGYGESWVKAVAEDYTANIATDVSIELKRSTRNDVAKSKIQSSSCDDLYIAETDFFDMQAYLENLDDLYETEVYGEAGVKVKDKLSGYTLSYYAEKGGYYQIPQTNMYGYNWVYNKTVLDNALGEGEYVLPRTTDEFFALGDRLFSVKDPEKFAYLTATALGGESYEEYLEYAFRAWLQQMTGAEAYEKFFGGMYPDGGEWLLAETSPRPLFENNRTAIEATYELARKLCIPRTLSGADVDYLHSYSKDAGFKDVDTLFYGGKINGRQQFPIAFHYTGIWLETEMASDIALGYVDGSQEIYAMKMPVISAITQRTPTIGDDETLAAVVDYVDGNGERPDGVSDADVEIVREARNVKSEMITRTILIPKNGKNKDISKNFIAYLFSERAQKIAAKNANGISVLPYGYEPVEEDMGFEISPYIKSVLAISEDAVICDISHNNMSFPKVTHITWYEDPGTIANDPLALALYLKGDRCPTAAEIVEKTINAFDNGWKLLIDSYKRTL